MNAHVCTSYQSTFDFVLILLLESLSMIRPYRNKKKVSLRLLFYLIVYAFLTTTWNRNLIACPCYRETGLTRLYKEENHFSIKQ